MEAEHEDSNAVGVVLAGGEVKRSQPSRLVGSWHVDRLRTIAGSLEPLLEGTRVHAQFDDAGAIVGSAGCNSYRGSFEMEGDSITVGTLATTRKFCLRPPGVMEQEARYLEVLATAVHYSFGPEDTLRLSDDAGAVVLELTRVEDQGKAEVP